VISPLLANIALSALDEHFALGGPEDSGQGPSLGSKSRTREFNARATEEIFSRIP
jgi:hypothetical protein